MNGKEMIYDYTITTGKGELLSLSDYKGKVIMVVNTATGCGFTPQYAPIEQMYEKYHDKGLEILDIPCKSSAGRHPELMMRSMIFVRCTLILPFRR